MREFNVIPHGAGKNFLGAIQTVIKGKEKVHHIENLIKDNNLFDAIYAPFHFNPNFYDRTTWNQDEAQMIWERCLNKRYETNKAKREVINLCNDFFKGTQHLDFSLPGISQYGIICLMNSVEQRAELDRLAHIKHKIKWEDDPHRYVRSQTIHTWEHTNITSYKADFVYDYSSVFHELDQRVITEIIERTEETFKVESPITIADVTSLIAKYNRRNHEILENE